MVRNKTQFKVTENCNATFDSSTNTITGPPDFIAHINYMLDATYIPTLNKYVVNSKNY